MLGHFFHAHRTCKSIRGMASIRAAFFLVHPWLKTPQIHMLVRSRSGDGYGSGQIIATSSDLTTNGGLVKEITLFEAIQVGEIL